MKFELDNNELKIYLSGNIDSTNAKDAENDIQEIIKKNRFEKLVIDAKDLSYISSAGLRIILVLMRTYPGFQIINCNNEVYDVFEITGFTQMMTIKKAYREFDISNCVKIGEGAKGIVYRFNEDIIVKVFKYSDALDDIERERNISKEAFILGIPTAISYDIVKVGDKYAAVYELLKSSSMSELIAKNPNKIDFYAAEYARLLKIVHETMDLKGVFESVKRTPKRWLKKCSELLKKESAEKIEKMIDEMEDEKYLVHGDFHSSNIMLQDKEFLVIDLDTLKYGNPIIDLAIIDFAYSSLNQYVKNNSLSFLGIEEELAIKFYEAFLKLYFDGVSKDKMERNLRKIRLLSLMRVIGHLPGHENEKEMTQQAVHEIEALLPLVNDFNLEK